MMTPIYTEDGQLENPRIVYSGHGSPASASTGPLDDSCSDMEVLLLEKQDEVEALRRVSGQQDLSTLTTLTMTVDASEVSVSRLGEYLPQLRELKLNYSSITTARELGTALKHLQVLWLSRVGLQRLDGLSGLPALRELYASFNSISSLEPLQGCDDLEVLDLESNCVSSIDEVGLLGLCQSLENVSLEGNPVAAQPGYRNLVAQAVPRLLVLDDEPVTEEERTSTLAVASREGFRDKEWSQGVEGPVSSSQLRAEAELISSAVRYARVGFDSHEFEEVEAAVAEGVDVRPGTAGLRTSLASLRPKTTGQLCAGSGGLARAGRSSSASSSRPSSAFRPSSAAAHGRTGMGGRPRSASALSGQRLGAGGSLSASTGGLFWKKHRLGSGSSNGKVHDVDDDSGPDGVVSSSLTMGNGALVGGGPAAALRRRRADPVVSSLRQLSSSVDPSLRKSIGSPDMSTEQILEELRAWKISATESALREEEVAVIPVISSSDSDEDVDILPSIDTEAIKGGDLFTLGDSTSDEEAQEELPAPSDALDGSRIEAARDIEWGESTETCEAVAATAIVWSRTSSQGSQRPSSALSSPRTPRKISRHRKAVEMAHDFVWQTDQSPSMTPVRAGSNPSMSPVSSSDDDGERAPASPNRTRTGSIPSSRGSSVRSSEGGGSLQRSVVSGESAHKIAAGGPGLPPSGLVEPRPPAPRVLGQQDGLRMDSSCGRSSAASSRRSSDSEGLRMPT